MPFRLADLAWPEVEGRAARTVLLVPVGSTEQHGPHLPLDTDTLIAEAVAARLAARVDDVLVAPSVTYGSSGEHAGFPGTLSIGQEALELVLLELVRSADAFRGVLLVDAHGGNAEPVQRAVARLQHEGRRVAVWRPGLVATDAHAGRTETSILLAIRPEAVRLPDAVPGNLTPLPELLPALRAEGVRPLAANGVLGDPAGASAAEGDRLLDAMVGDAALVLERLR